MGGIGIWQIVIVALVVLILFGRGRISEMMGDFGKGISSFKKGLSEEEEQKPASKAQIEAPAQETTAAPNESQKKAETGDASGS